MSILFTLFSLALPFLMAGLYFALFSKAGASGFASSLAFLPILAWLCSMVIQTIAVGKPENVFYQLTMLNQLIATLLQLAPLVYLALAKWPAINRSVEASETPL